MTIHVDFIDFEDMLDFAEKLTGMTKRAASEENLKELNVFTKGQDQHRKAADKTEEISQVNKDIQEEVKTEEAPSESTVTLEEVRAKLAELNKAGKRSAVKELLSGFGAAKLSEIPEDKYPEVMAKAGEL